MDTILIWIDSRHSTGPSFSPAVTLNIEHVSISKDYKWIFADSFPQTRQFIPTVLAPCNTSCYFIVKADTKANAHTHTQSLLIAPPICMNRICHLANRAHPFAVATFQVGRRTAFLILYQRPT